MGDLTKDVADDLAMLLNVDAEKMLTELKFVLSNRAYYIEFDRSAQEVSQK